MALAVLKRELDTWDAALQAYDSEDLDGALSIFEKISDTSKVAINIGLIHMYQGNFDHAIAKFTDAIKLDHFLAVGYFQRGVCHYKVKAMEKALQDFVDAEVMMRGNQVVYYQELGLQFELHTDRLLLDRGLTLIQLGRYDDGMKLVWESGSLKEENSEIYAMPTGLLFRPPASKRLFLLKYQHATGAESRNFYHSNTSTPMSPVPFSSGPKSDSSSTYAPSTSDRDSVSVREERSSIQKDRGYFVSSDAKHTFPSTSSSTLRHLRTDLIKVLGPDLTTPTTEISTVPCAGVRIASGRLIGLMGWRLVVELVDDDDKEDYQNEKNHRRRTWGQKQKVKGKFKVQYKTPAIVGNFILDTGSAKSVVSQDALRALKYLGKFNPGAEVTLRIQGVRTQCLVARLGEASTLGGQFMTSGNLTFYFDNKMNAPVLYVGDEANERPTSDIPRTVASTGMDRRNRRISLRESVSLIMALFKHNETVVAV